MIGSTKALLHSLPLLAAALAGTVDAAPHFQFPLSKLGSDTEIDLSKYTIGQILNYTLHHRKPHHDHDHDDRHFGYAERDGDDHRHPRGPPLFKLAYVVNRTESVSRDLELLGRPIFWLTKLASSDQGIPE